MTYVPHLWSLAKVRKANASQAIGGRPFHACLLLRDDDSNELGLEGVAMNKILGDECALGIHVLDLLGSNILALVFQQAISDTKTYDVSLRVRCR